MTSMSCLRRKSPSDMDLLRRCIWKARPGVRRAGQIIRRLHYGGNARRVAGRVRSPGDIRTDPRAGPRDGMPSNDNGANPDDPDRPDTAGSIPLGVELAESPT